MDQKLLQKPRTIDTTIMSSPSSQRDPCCSVTTTRMTAPPLDYETQYIKRGILRSLTDPSSTCLLTIAKQQHHSGTTKVLSVQRDHNRLTTTVVTNRPLMNPTRLRFELMKQLSGMPVIHHSNHTDKQTSGSGGSGGMIVGGQHGGSNSMLVTDEMLMHFAREAQRLADEEEEEEQNAGYIYTSSEDGDDEDDTGGDDRDQFNQYDNADFLYRADQQLQQMEQELNHMTQVVNELRSNMVANDNDSSSERTHGADDDDNDDDLMHEGELSEEAISALWSGPIGSHGLYGRGPGSSDEEGDDDDDDENDYHMSDNENDRYYY